MKKIYSKIGSTMLLSAGLTMCLAACTSDDESTNPSKDEKIAWTFEVGNGDVRTMLDPDANNKVVFKKGDSISVFNNADASENAKFKAEKMSGDTASVAKFNGEANIGAQNFWILYPYQDGATCASGVITATIPTEQTATPNNFDPKANISVATTEAHAWDVPKFYLKNVVGLLKFTAGTNADVTEYDKIVIKDANNSEEIAGKVSITVSGTGAPAHTVITGEKKITLTDVEPGKLYYVALLPKSFAKGITMDFFKGAAKVGTKKIFNGIAGPTVNRSRVCNVGTVTPEKPEPAFSVSNDGGTTITKVKFAQGNLYCKKDDSGTWTWGFYENQWQYNSLSMGNSSRTASNTDTEIDLFCWGYDEAGSTNPVEKKTRSTFTDWGDADAVKAGIGDGWRTLTSTEWNYLLTLRKLDDGTTACACYAKATVHSVPGLLIIPDGYEVTNDNKTEVDDVTITNVNVTDAGYDSNKPSDADWNDKLEKAGCVFLPCAGTRYGSSVSNVGSYGYYWSSSPDTLNASNAYNMYFGAGSVSPQGSNNRYYGRTVRLVCASE